jgi:enoyl-CoA hydratase/carnithine racemase
MTTWHDTARTGARSLHRWWRRRVAASTPRMRRERHRAAVLMNRRAPVFETTIALSTLAFVVVATVAGVAMLGGLDF